MFLFLLLFGFTHGSQASDDISVIDVRRNITLSEVDPVYKDFYINAGPSSGLKKNLVVTAVRKINIRDASGANAVGEILVPVGKLRIIAVFDRVAVAREHTLLSRDELPMLEQTGIMTGDRIDLKGSFIDNSKPKKRKVAQSTQAKPETVVAVTLAPNPVESANIQANSIIKSAPPALPTSESPTSSAPAGETLEKTADSGNNTLHE